MVKERFLSSCISFAILQDLGNFLEGIERLHKSVLDLARTFAPSLRKRQDILSKAVVLDAAVFFETFKIVFLEAVARLKELPGIRLL